MSDTSKIKPTHTQRAAVIYIRQSSPTQVVNNRESTEWQYALVKRAIDLGWLRDQITILDEDLGVAADGIAKRAGFAQLTAEVALLKVGLVVGLEVSRLARNNANWYRLLDLCGITAACSYEPNPRGWPSWEAARRRGLYHPLGGVAVSAEGVYPSPTPIEIGNLIRPGLLWSKVRRSSRTSVPRTALTTRPSLPSRDA